MTDINGNSDHYKMDAVYGFNHAPVLGTHSPYSCPANIYPDPDDMPTYPWLGAEPSEHVFQPQRPSTSQKLWPQEPPVDFEHDSEIEVIDDARLPARRDPNDPLVDPDFQFSDASVGSDDFLSEAGSRSPSAVAKVNGRGRGRPGGFRFQEGHSASKRGRGGQSLHRGRGGKGIKRGPRKPLEPNIEFKAFLSQATTAFIANDYEEAERLALRAINVNPEMFAAHSLLSEIHMARGDGDKALTALFNGAHTRPGDAQVWHRVAHSILEREVEDRNSALPDAIYCLSRVINIQQDNVEARYQRASLNRVLGYNGRAANEYEQLLKYLPHDTDILRKLAEIYIELGEVDMALQHFDDGIAYHQLKEPTMVTSFSWSDVNVYTELYGYQDQYKLGIKKLKSLSRWLLGRKKDSLWETVDGDDREWDLEDQPRRVTVTRFVSGVFPAQTYGEGLPLELRVKLGVYRLSLGDSAEALNHLEWLDPEDYGPDAKLFDYTDLFREAADALRVAALYNEALRFYEPLQEVADYVNASYLSDMAFCYREAGLREEAEDCYQTIVDSGDYSVDIRPQLITMCKEHSMTERSKKLLKQFSVAANERLKQSGATSAVAEDDRAVDPNSSSTTMLAPRPIALSKTNSLGRAKRLLEQEQLERDRESRIYGHFLRLQASVDRSRLGEEAARLEWMSIAKILIQDFRSNSIFYPTDKYMRFLGYTSEARARSAVAKPSQSSTETQHGDDNIEDLAINIDSTPVPQDYHGIPFHTWLDIFLEYALFLAQDGNLAFSYDVIAGARDANVFYHSPDSLLLIYVCWFSCALLQNDEPTLCTVSRWFMREYQFVTDSYRLFGALNRLCDTDNEWFNSSPSQKFVLRQIKAVDYSLIRYAHSKSSIFQDRAGFNRDSIGNEIFATDMDVALLMLYGQILYAGRNFTFALNYFFRAYALEPDNPMINLSIALSYVQHAVKRQADNRHHLVMQGFAFLSRYYDVRCASGDPCGRQEAEYNIARAYHLLGLPRSAIIYYKRCLNMRDAAHGDRMQKDMDDFSREAALALQGLWAAAGDHEEARQLTRAWLVI